MDNHPDFIYFKDNEARFVIASKNFCDLFGRSMEDIIGKTDLELFPEDIAEQFYNDDLYVIKNREPIINREETALEKWVITTKIPWIDNDGNVKGLFGISHDITRRKKTEQKLEESEEKYREAYYLINFYKDLFAHDMNNILQGIISTAEMHAQFRNDPEKLKKFGDITEVVKKQAERGYKLISNIMKLSKLDEGEPHLRAIGFFDALTKSVDLTVNGFQERNVNIEVNGLSKDKKILGNELIIDIFENLLNNAVKYNYSEEEVKIAVIVSKIQEGGIKYIKFEFKDYGIGISDNKKESIFKRTYDRKIFERGMGMGLSLVKKIVDKYGGKIWVEDRIQEDFMKGSNFVVLLKEVI